MIEWSPFFCTSSTVSKPRCRRAARFAYTSVSLRSRIVIASPSVSSSSANSGPNPLRMRSPSGTTLASSAPVEKLFGRVDQPQTLGYTREVEQPLDLLGASDEGQHPPVLGQPLVSIHDDAQPSRVHEFEFAQVKHQQLGLRGP